MNYYYLREKIPMVLQGFSSCISLEFIRLINPQIWNDTRQESKESWGLMRKLLSR